MPMLKKFKAFLNKEGCDYSEGLVDPFEFHKTFYRILVAFKVANVEEKYKTSFSRWLNQNTILFVSGLMATIMACISLYHGVETFDIPHITEAGTYAMVLFYELLIMYCTKWNLPQYHNLTQAMKEDFYYICTEGARYRKKYFENQLLTWKICIVACIFCVSVGIGMATYSTLALFFYLAYHKEGEEWKRPLFFPFWLPNVHFEQTPYYEIALVFSNTCLLLYSYMYIFNLQTQIVWIRHLSSKVDIIVWRIQDLLEDVRPATNKEEYEYFSNLLESRLREIIIHHQAMLSVVEDYAIVYKKLLLFEQQFCGPVVCLTAYCTAEKLDDGEIQPILPLLGFATIVLHFIPSYSCTFLAEKAKSICDACWSIPFWIATPVIRPYMVLLMQRALRPLPLQAPGFHPISIETFSKKMTSAYSFFNMLRQSKL